MVRAPIRRRAVPLSEGFGVGTLDVPPLGLGFDGKGPLVAERDDRRERFQVIPAYGRPEHHQTSYEGPVLEGEVPEHGRGTVVQVVGESLSPAVLIGFLYDPHDRLAFMDPGGGDEVHLAGAALQLADDTALPGIQLPVLLQAVDEEGRMRAGYPEDLRDAVLGYLLGRPNLYGWGYVPVPVQVQQCTVGERKSVHGCLLFFRE